MRKVMRISTIAGNVAAALALLLALPPAPAATGTTATVMAKAPQLRLRWELQRNVFSAEAPRGRSLARLVLTNLDSQPLPAQGWALYFNANDGVEPNALDGKLVLERVGGTLFRVRPVPGFAGLAAGQALNIDYYHPEVLANTARAPVGPYLVFDRAPEAGHAVADYQIVPMSRPEQVDKGPADRTPTITPEAVFKHNEIISAVPDDALAPVFPTPRSLERRAGQLRLAAPPAILAAPALRHEAAFAKQLLAPYFSAGAAPAGAPLRLAVGPIEGQASPEAYQLTVDPAAGIMLKGASPAGVFMGLQSLRELLPLAPQAGQGIDLAALFISDAPRFGYRGFQLDVGRNFHPKATVFKLLDLMARYKLNKLHFHLTEDEGWRLEIASIPELTAIGARRGHTLATPQRHLQPAYGSGPSLNDPYGSGFYTRADYIEILKYAAARHIDVIPELEMPGHARAAVKAMESRFRRLEKQGKPNARQYLLNDLDDKSEYLSAQLYDDNVMNPGLESTYAFIERVVADVAALYKEAGVPLATIHVGGDELPDGAWEKSPASAALMKRMRLASRADLWDYFYDRVDRILRRHGLFASGWEELGARRANLGGASKQVANPRFTQRGFNVYVWNNTPGSEDLANRLANAGYGTVLAPVTNLYFDMAHNKNPDEPGVNWGGYVDLDTVYDFVPFDMLRGRGAQGMEVLGDYGRNNIRGLEATLFSETIRDPARIDYLIMPRMLALAERAWAPDPAWAREPDSAKATLLHHAAWSGFVSQLGKRVLPRLDLERAGVQYRIAPPGLKVEDGRVLVNHQLPGLTLRYTTDGSEPGPASAVVQGPIAAKGRVRVAAFDRNGRAGRSSQVDNP